MSIDITHFVMYRQPEGLTTYTYCVQPMPTSGFGDPATWALPAGTEILFVYHNVPNHFSFSFMPGAFDAIPSGSPLLPIRQGSPDR